MTTRNTKMEKSWVLSFMEFLDGLPQTSGPGVHLNLHETWLVWIFAVSLTEIGLVRLQEEQI